MTVHRMLMLALAAGLAGACASEPVMVSTAPSSPPSAGGVRTDDVPMVWATNEETIRDEVIEELGDEGLDASAIAVLVEGNRVALRGTVSSIDEWDLARRVAADVEGVAVVDARSLAIRRGS